MTIRVVLTEQLINSLMDKKSESINIILQAKLPENLKSLATIVLFFLVHGEMQKLTTISPI